MLGMSVSKKEQGTPLLNFAQVPLKVKDFFHNLSGMMPVQPNQTVF